MSDPGDITRLLREWNDGQPDAFQKLFPLVYRDLHRIAYSYLQRERPGNTLQATALVHELYLRLRNQHEAQWDERAHFYTFAAKVMRMILADHIRQRLREKRGGDLVRVPLSPELPWVDVNSRDFLDLERALDDLEQIDSRKTRMIELHHFLGCTVEESASLLEISLATAERDLKFARGWLYRRLLPDGKSTHG